MAFSRPIVNQPSVLMVTTVGSLKHSEIEHTILKVLYKQNKVGGMTEGHFTNESSALIFNFT